MGNATDCSTRVRCPKCRSRDLELTEVGYWTSSWIVIKGRTVRKEGYHEPGGMDRVDAECRKCKHLWRVRGAIQITDVLTMDEGLSD